MLSPRTMVVCPTWTPLTSVIALSGPRPRTPIFSPISEARGRLLEFEVCALLGDASRIIATPVETFRITRNRVTGDAESGHLTHVYKPMLLYGRKRWPERIPLGCDEGQVEG